MLIKYRKLFGFIRLILGVIFFSYPLIEFVKANTADSINQQKWLFALFFFLLYMISAVKNGFRELSGKLPSFDLLRFFEIAMNGFMALYMILISIAAKAGFATTLAIFFLALILILNMVRDLQIVSFQYYEKKNRLGK